MSGLVPGLFEEVEFEAAGEMLTDLAGTIPRPVLATPRMIQMMERAGRQCAHPHLEPGTTTVGFEVCVRHVAPAVEGTRCTARATLREVLDGRKLRFDVEVVDALGKTIGVGTHERRIIRP